MPFVDWYLVLTPLFALMTFLTLLTLKFALHKRPQHDIQTLTSAKEERDQEAGVKEPGIFETNPVLKTYAFLMKNHSFLEPCFIKRAKNKLPTLLAIAVISILCFVNPSLYIYSFVGIPIVLGFVMTESCIEVEPADPSDGLDFNLEAVKEAAFQQERMESRN